MIAFRQVRDGDLGGLYAISLATGHLGGDASAHYRDGRMMGHIYAAPYAKLTPETCLVVEDGEGLAGFAAGAYDTPAFERRLEREWWPHLREVYPDPSDIPAEERDADQRRSHMIHYPRKTPADITGPFPAHLHMNFLPRLQRRGIGSRLLEVWLGRAVETGVAGVHVGINQHNEGALQFWRALGFEAIMDPLPEGHFWHGRRLRGVG